MSWSSELIITFSTVTDMIDAGNITGVNQIANGTICIVENEDNNSYVFNKNIKKWKPREGNIYDTANLPSAENFNIDNGLEIWDKGYKLKRRWENTEWKLQKNVSNVMLSGYGPPTSEIGEYGNYYTDLDTGKIYSRSELTKTRVDAVGLLDSGILLVTSYNGYTVSDLRDALLCTAGNNFNECIVSNSNYSINSYLIFDFQGVPLKITDIYMGFPVIESYDVGTTFTWYASNDINGTWEQISEPYMDVSRKFCISQCSTSKEYRYYKLSWVIKGGERLFKFNDLWFLSSSGESSWELINTGHKNNVFFSHGVPDVSIGVMDSVSIDVDTGDIYKKNDVVSSQVFIDSYTGVTNGSYLFDNNLTNYLSGSHKSIISLTTPVQLNKIIFKKTTTNVINLYALTLFGSNDNNSWEYIHQYSVSGDVNTDIEIDIPTTNSTPYRYFYFRVYNNSRTAEIQLFTNTLVSWNLISNFNNIDSSSFTNFLNSSINNLQLLAERLDKTNQTIVINNDRVITTEEFHMCSRFKVISTEPILITLPILNSTHNNKMIEIIKLSKGDIFITTNDEDPLTSESVVVNNIGAVGDSITIEYAHEVPIFLAKSVDGLWDSLVSVPNYATIQNIEIGSDGCSWAFTFSNLMTSGADGFETGLSVESYGGPLSLTYFSGIDTNTIIYKSNLYIDSVDSVSGGLSYVQPGQGIKDIDNNSIKSFSFNSIVNSSQLTPPLLASCTIQPDGVTWVLVFSTPINPGDTPNTFSVTMTTVGSVVLTYQSGGGTNTINFTGSVIVPATDTVSDGLNFNGTSKSWKSVDKELILRSFSDFTIINNSAI